MRTKKEILGKFSIELIEKENSMYSLDITLELNNEQIDVLTDILYQGYKGEYGERFSNLVEDTEITLAKILYSYDIKELVPLIQERAKERGIFDNSTPFNQLLKIHEEAGELIKACYDDDRPAIKYAIGDTMICLINYCYFVFKNKDYAIEIINARYMFDSFEGSSTINYLSYITKILIILFNEEFLLQENSNHTRNVFFRLSHISQLIEKIAQDNNTTLEECLTIAYNEIKNRKGKIINGKFIKDEHRKQQNRF